MSTRKHDINVQYLYDTSNHTGSVFTNVFINFLLIEKHSFICDGALIQHLMALSRIEFLVTVEKPFSRGILLVVDIVVLEISDSVLRIFFF